MTGETTTPSDRESLRGALLIRLEDMTEVEEWDDPGFIMTSRDSSSFCRSRSLVKRRKLGLVSGLTASPSRRGESRRITDDLQRIAP